MDFSSGKGKGLEIDYQKGNSFYLGKLYEKGFIYWSWKLLILFLLRILLKYLPVFIDRKCFGIDCREEGNGPTDTPDDDDCKDDNDLGDPEYTH